MTSRRDFLLAGSAAAAWMTLPGSVRAAVEGEAARPLDILVMGGTGFLGPHFVEAARDRGHRLTLFNRGKSNPTRFSGEAFKDIEQLHGDRKSDLAALEGTRRWDAVLDTSAYLPADVTRSAELLAPRVGQYLIVSSISVYADNATPDADETAAVATIPDPTVTEITGETYGALKALCEQAAEKAMPGRTTVVRPGLIVGPGDTTDRFTYWPARAARGGEILAPGAPDNPTQVIDVRDLAEFMLRLIETRNFDVFNADAPAGKLTMGALLDACQKAGTEANQVQCVRAPCDQPAAASSTVTWVPADFLEQQKVSAWQDMPAWIPPTGEYAAFGLRSSARAQAAGLTYRSLDTTVHDTLQWWLALPEERRAKPKAGIDAEREAEVLRAWHARKTA
ncbi:NAD-dependent epimerase/dehydratase family protein [Pseudoxanthomonas putridarboris]|uniref:NAD-dependent epimerase/dehydratase family protein n=1 Tax=Pseudoxanthomonas putridarboris TaxID=752605 RepID=A0ABU9IX61_9GAMM